MRMLTTSLGVGASLILLFVSGAMNYLFLSSLGKSPLEAHVLGAASASADILKALLPFFIAWSWRSRRYAVAIPGVLVWMFFAGFSLLSAIGFAADNRGDFSQSRENLNAAYEAARSELKGTKAKLAVLPAHRPAAVVSAAIDGHKQDRRWSATSGCTDATLSESREYCERYFALRAELAAGAETDRLARKAGHLKNELTRLQASGAGRQADPQVFLLARLFGHMEERIRLALILIIALLVETGSSLGLFLSANHGMLPVRWGRSYGAEEIPRVEDTQPPIVPPETRAASTMRPPGDVVDFALARLWPEAGSTLTEKALFEAYRKWCEASGHAALKKEDFHAAFQTLARQIGLEAEDGRYPGIAVRQ